MKIFKKRSLRIFGEQFNTDFSPAEVAAACGGKQGLFNAACTILNPDDELLIPKPYWVTFPEIGNFCRAKNVFIETEETDFVLTADQVKASITDKTKLLIINSPNNPTGRVIPADEMRRIVEVCAERNVYRFDGRVLSLFRISAAGAIYLGIASSRASKICLCRRQLFKDICDDGLAYRIYDREPRVDGGDGQTAEPLGNTPDIIRSICLRQSSAECRPDDRIRPGMTAEYERRRDWLIPALNEIDGFKCEMPEGAFYAFVDVRDMLGTDFKSSADVAEFLLRDAYTVVTDGAGFGADGFLRISYATSMENLQAAVDRMKSALSLSKRGKAV